MPDLEQIRATFARVPNHVSVLESLFAFAPVGFQIYEASGRSILVNQAFIDLFGSEPPPEYNVLQDEIAAKRGILDSIRRAFQGETTDTPPIWYDPRELTQVNVEKGNRVAVSASFFPLLDEKGKVTHVAIAFKDLTAQMTQHEQLEQERELLSQAAHFRERFIGILGHDLRSPLGAIMAGAGTILRLRDAPDRVLAAAARISSSGERMLRMISDLLDFAQARLGGGLSVQRKPTDLGEVASAVVEEVSAANPARSIALEIEGDVRGSFDPDRAAQLLSNLVANAVTHAPPDDRIVVRVTGNATAVELSVENGGTIPEAERVLLFDPFRRGSVSRDSRGLGLGLFIVQQIARAHGGNVDLVARDGRIVFRAVLQR
jgi:signal transduction histidine kinase